MELAGCLFTALQETLSIWWWFTHVERKRERQFSQRTGGSWYYR